MRARPQLWFWLVVAATLWAAVLRLPALARLPPQSYVDEAWYNVTAQGLLLNKTLQVFYPTAWGGMRPMLVGLAAIVQAMGFHSLVASRGVTAPAGILVIPLTFVCCDEMLRRESWTAQRRRLTAAVAAVVGSSLILALVASRGGQAPILIPLLALVAVWQMRRAERTGRRLNWALAGLALGAAQYVNINGLFVLAVVGLLALFDLARAPSSQRPALFLRLALMGLLAGVIALPLIVFFVQQPQWFFSRANTVSPHQSRLLFYLNNTWLIARSFSLLGDASPLQNVPGRPMLDWLQSIGFWAGLAWAAWRSRRSATGRDLLAWLLITCLPSILTLDAPQFERMIGAAAPVPMLVAVGWSELWQALSQWLRSARPSFRRRLSAATAAAIGLALGLASMGATAYAYFVVYPRTPDLAAAFTATPASVARQMIDRSQTQPVFVERTPEADDSFAFEFLLPGTAVQRLDFRQCLPHPDRSPTGATYLVLTDHDPQTVAVLRQLYPAATVTPIDTESAALIGKMAVVDVPPGAARPPAPHPAGATFADGIGLLGYDWSGPVVTAGQPLYITLYWRAEMDIHLDATAFVHIGRGDAGSRLIAQHDGHPCQGLYPTSRWRAAEVVPDSFAIPIPAGTAPGIYPVLAGWYDSNTQQRLALASADNPLPDNRALIANIQVTAQ
jgi:hypothetical protein